jgi:hypothetical protein
MKTNSIRTDRLLAGHVACCPTVNFAKFGPNKNHVGVNVMKSPFYFIIINIEWVPKSC